MSDRVVLAYSGGLDTSVAIPYLAEQTGAEVIAVAIDVGQGGEDMDVIRQRALDCGAVEAEVIDGREEFAAEYCIPAIRANALYMDRYPLVSALSRPLIVKHLVAAAKKYGGTIVSHGCTGKGNDQVRFELTVMALNPRLHIIAPWREWNIKGRIDALDYAAEHNVPVKATMARIYSQDKNLWHLSNEGGPLEDPWNEPPADMFEWTINPENAPDEPEYVEIEFERGFPTSVNGQQLDPVSLVKLLNELGAKHGVGRVDIVENRLVGMKSRGVYETPGGTILYRAHEALEQLCLDRNTLQYKQQVGLKFAELVYNGQWFTPLREALSAFVNSTEQTVTGTVRLKLYKGNIILAGRKSPYSLYRQNIVTFEEGDYNHADATGFIRLFGLPLKVQALTREDSK
jgi:argininosuccinate synthase